MNAILQTKELGSVTIFAPKENDADAPRCRRADCEQPSKVPSYVRPRAEGGQVGRLKPCLIARNVSSRNTWFCFRLKLAEADHNQLQISHREFKVATIVSFISEKGGVGKTTACYHVAVGLARYHGKSVLVVDADYQRGGITGRFFPDAIDSFGSGTAPGETIFHKYQQLYSASAQTKEVDIRTWSGVEASIDVIPADPRLASVSVDKLPSTNNIRANNQSLLKHLQSIQYVLSGVEEEYDYILIDSHPEVSDVLRSVIYASDFCVSPVKLDRQSSIGVATILGEINNVNADVEMIQSTVGGFTYQETEFSGSIGMMAREWGGELKQSEQSEYNRLRRTGGVFENYVTEGDGLRQAAAERVPVYDINLANAERQASQFRALVAEFLGVCK